MSIHVPKYRHHRASGQAFIEILGHRHYLGKSNTASSQERYRQIVAELVSSGDAPSLRVGDQLQLTINELVLDTYFSPSGSEDSNTLHV